MNGLNEYTKEETKTDTPANTGTPKKRGIPMFTVTQTPDWQKRYIANREILKMSEAMDKPIILFGWEIGMKENFKKKLVEMATLYYVFEDDEAQVTHITSTESSPILDTLKSFTEEEIKRRDEAGGFITRIYSHTNGNAGQTYYLQITPRVEQGKK